MRIPIAHSAVAVAVVASALALSPGAAGAQTKTVDGHPDLQGVWRVQPGIAVYSYDIEAPAPQEAYPSIPGGQGFFGMGNLKATFRPIVVDPPDNRIPYQPWARALRESLYKAAFRPQSLKELDPQAMCVPSGPPRIAYQGSVQIFQPPGYVVFANETVHQARAIPLDGRPHLTDKIKLFAGDGRGRWEGNALVIEYTNFNGRNWLDVAGDIRTDAFKVVERWTRMAADSLQYEATIEDPNLYTRPWKLRINLVPQAPDYSLLEEACYEGNRALEELKQPHGRQETSAVPGGVLPARTP